jgi:hypothetical protein
MHWELQPENSSKLDGFRRDYCDTTKRLTEVIRDYGLGQRHWNGLQTP